MTDKDPKDMTVSELLRLADSHPCSMCRLVMAGEESCATTGCASWAYRLADKIDAELAQARGEALLQGAQVWAKANGWPDFREGEDFGAWLDRCAFAKPLDERGEPVQIGERAVDKVRGEVDVTRVSYTASGLYFNNSHNSGGTRIAKRITYAPGERVKRPAPEVLGADGLPLDEDDTVYGTGREQHRYTVQVPYSINEEVGKRFCVQCYDHDEGNITWCDPSMLTHERPVLGADGLPLKVGETTWGVVIGNRKPPIASVHKKGETIDGMHVKFDFVRYADGGYDWAQDLTHTPADTQWDIDDDATMAPRDYYARYIGHDVGLKDDAEVTEAMVRDLLRRQRELDKRTGGE